MTLKKRNSDETKNRILSVALNVFAQKGFDAATTREICEKASVNINLIYYYFGGKKELYNTLIEKVFEKQTELFNSRFDLSTDFTKLSKVGKIQALQKVADTMIDFLYKSISKEQVSFFLNIQQSKEGLPYLPPAYYFIAKIFASIFENMNKKEIFFEMMFFMSQIAFPKIVPGFAIKTLGKSDFKENDIKIIQKHIKQYISTMISAKVG